MKIAISGGGIGGLTLAIALQRKGFDAIVYESAPGIKPLGAGLVLAANAIKALIDIGISEEVLNAGRVIRKLKIKDQYGRTLSETDSREINIKFGFANNFAIHRADLHKVLIDLLAPGSLHMNKTCVDFKQTNSRVSLEFHDGTSAEADCLVVCEGIHSAIRKKLLPKTVPRYAGYTCWRAVIDSPPADFDANETTETWGDAGRFGIVPLTRNRVYWFACINAPSNDAAFRAFRISHLHHHFKHFHNPVPDLLLQTKGEQLVWNDIVDLKPLKRFAFGNIVLLGDAAHATTPNMGQGACLAIEDAAVLSNYLSSIDSINDAFHQFERKRIKRTTRIVNQSWYLGKIAQLKNPLLTGLRNAVLKWTPQNRIERQMEFLYNTDLY